MQEHPAPPALPTSELITRLTGQLRPVRRLWRPSTRLALVGLVQLLVLGAAGLALGVRADLATKLHDDRLVIELASVIALATACVVMTLLIAIPGREPTRRLATGTVATAVLGLTISFASFPPGDSPGFVAMGWPCAARTLVVAAVPWLVLVLAVRRGATLFPALAGMLAGTASLLFASASVRMSCPLDTAGHLLMWHLLPVVVGVVASILVGILCLSDRRRGRRDRLQ